MEHTRATDSEKIIERAKRYTCARCKREVVKEQGDICQECRRRP